VCIGQSNQKENFYKIKKMGFEHMHKRIISQLRWGCSSVVELLSCTCQHQRERGTWGRGLKTCQDGITWYRDKCAHTHKQGRKAFEQKAKSENEEG
jgi:hypothetical protein